MDFQMPGGEKQGEPIQSLEKNGKALSDHVSISDTLIIDQLSLRNVGYKTFWRIPHECCLLVAAQ